MAELSRPELSGTTLVRTTSARERARAGAARALVASLEEETAQTVAMLAEVRAETLAVRAAMSDMVPQLYPKLIVLCGLPGSGKSTISLLCASLGWLRCSEEDNNNSPEAVVSALQAGAHVVIDQCNVTASRRARWSALGRDDCGLTPSEMVTVWTNSSIDACVHRISHRPPSTSLGSHLTFETPRGVILKSVKSYAKRWEDPPTGPHPACLLDNSATHGVGISLQPESAEGFGWSVKLDSDAVTQHELIAELQRHLRLDLPALASQAAARKVAENQDRLRMRQVGGGAVGSPNRGKPFRPDSTSPVPGNKLSNSASDQAPRVRVKQPKQPKQRDPAKAAKADFINAIAARLCQAGVPKDKRHDMFKVAIDTWEAETATEDSETVVDDAGKEGSKASLSTRGVIDPATVDLADAIEQLKTGPSGEPTAQARCLHPSITFCPHLQCCMACGFGCCAPQTLVEEEEGTGGRHSGPGERMLRLTSCDICGLARANSAGVARLVERLRPRAVAIDFDGTLCLGSKGRDPSQLQLRPDPVLCALVDRDCAWRGHVVTRNRHKEGIQRFLASTVPATKLHESVHVVGYGNSKACAVCNQALMCCSKVVQPCPESTWLTVFIDDSAKEVDAELRDCPRTYCVIFSTS